MLSRRTLVMGAASAAALGSCARRSNHKWAPVTIVRAASYSEELYDLVRRVIQDQALQLKGKRVILKPNLVEFDEGSAINTHPKFVHAVREAFLSSGAAEVRIAEGPGHRRMTLDMADAAGFFRVIPNFEQSFTDLNLDEVTCVRLRSPLSKLSALYLPNTVLGCDLLVSIPKLKTHHWVGATLGMKNLFGLVPGGVYGWPKNVLHWAGIEQSIVDLHRLFPRHFTIVDGITGMQGNGPIQGDTKHLGVIVAGADPVAVDATCCRLMCLDPDKIGYLRLAAGAGALSEELIPQAGERISDAASPFALLPQFEGLKLRAKARG